TKRANDRPPYSIGQRLPALRKPLGSGIEARACGRRQVVVSYRANGRFNVVGALPVVCRTPCDLTQPADLRLCCLDIVVGISEALCDFQRSHALGAEPPCFLGLVVSRLLVSQVERDGESGDGITRQGPFALGVP